jgi:hypothetical protein
MVTLASNGAGVVPKVISTALVLTLLSSLAPAAFATTESFDDVGHWGVVEAGHEANFSFADEFDAPPVVVVSAQVGGQALLASTIHTHTGGFNIFVTDHNGQPVDRAWVQWIVVESDPAAGVQAGYALTEGGRIEFPEPFETAPIVVTNAWVRDKPMVSWTVEVDAAGFSLFALDAAGMPVDSPFNAYWIAVTPTAENGFVGGTGTYGHRDDVVFVPSSEAGTAYVLNAAGGLRAGSVDNRTDGFTVSLIDSTGQPTTGGDIQWLGYAGPPGETKEDGPATLTIYAVDGRGDTVAGVCWSVLTDGGSQIETEEALCDYDGDGLTAIELPAGDYTVKTASDPDGYTALDDAQGAALTAGATTELTFVFTRPGDGGESVFIGGDFRASILDGPNSGLEIAGHLSVEILTDGTIGHAVLATADGRELAVVGSIAGNQVGLVVTLADGDRMWLSGVASAPLPSGTGDAHGTIVGPAPEDTGSWSWTDLARESSCGPQPCPV